LFAGQPRIGQRGKNGLEGGGRGRPNKITVQKGETLSLFHGWGKLSSIIDQVPRQVKAEDGEREGNKGGGGFAARNEIAWKNWTFQIVDLRKNE